MKQLFKLVTENELIQPVLSIRVGERHCSLSVSDYAAAKVRMLGYYSTEELTTTFLDELFEILPELHDDFYRVMICYDFSQSILVPAKDYRHEDNTVLIQAMFGQQGNAHVVSEKLADWDLYNIYIIPQEIYDWINAKFPNAKYWHQASVLLKNSNGNSDDGNLMVDFREKDFSLLLTKQKKVLLARIFEYTSPADVIYYLLKTCQQFSLSQQTISLQLSGLVDRDSAMYKELHQYFLQIHLREAGWNITDSQYPEHYFTSLNDLAKCAS